MAFVLYRLLFVESCLNSKGEDRGALLSRWRPVWSALLVAAPLALVVLMILGYLITTIMLSLGLITSLGLVAAGALLADGGEDHRVELVEHALDGRLGDVFHVLPVSQEDLLPHPKTCFLCNLVIDRAVVLPTIIIES